MTREEAIAGLRQCPSCRRWRCYESCDHCLVDRIGENPTPARAIEACQRAIKLGLEAEKLRDELRGLLK